MPASTPKTTSGSRKRGRNMADHFPPLESDLILAELRAMAPHEWVELVEELEHTQSVMVAIKGVMALCLLEGDEVGLIGELAGLDRHLAHERFTRTSAGVREMRNER